jgi:hypothetical protein
MLPSEQPTVATITRRATNTIRIERCRIGFTSSF